MITMKLNGGKELHALLQQLPVEVETKIMRNALARGANVIRDEARARVADETGLLRKAIKSTRNTRKGQVIAKVKLRGRHSYLGLFMEYGVTAHMITVADGAGALKIGRQFVSGSVQHPGHAPRPFMRPALDTKAKEAINVIGQYISQYLKFGSIQAPTVSVDEEDA